jgi:hypothetical protein
MIIRSQHLQAGTFVFSDAKRLLQHYLPEADIRLFVAKPVSQYHLGAAICGVCSPALAE